MVIWTLLAVIGCKETPPVDTGTVEVSQDVGIGANAVLVRASIDLRGIRPSPEEIAWLQENPDQFPALIDEFLQDDRWPAQVRGLYTNIYQTRRDLSPVEQKEFGLDNTASLEQALGEESLRILSTVADEDLPWTDIVTADWTMANEDLVEVLPLNLGPDTVDWEKAVYTDGRPTAGVLSTASLWLRYTSTASNAHRGRANTVSRLMLCDNFMDREIQFDPELDLTNADAVKEALTENPSCLGCHVSLDPLGAHFWGFTATVDNALDKLSYHAEREALWSEHTAVPPAYFGTPTGNLNDMVQLLAADPRFVECAVQQIAEGLWMRPSTLADTGRLIQMQAEFEAGGLTMRPLFRSVVLGEVYQGIGGEDIAIEQKMARADQISSQIEALTGHRPTIDEFDVLESDLKGFRTLAGGVNGSTVLSPATGPTSSMLLVHERLAESAGWAVVQADSENRTSPYLFHLVDPSIAPQPEEITAQLQELHLRILSVDRATDSTAITTQAALFDDILALTDDPNAAWAAMVSILLRDPDFLFY